MSAEYAPDLAYQLEHYSALMMDFADMAHQVAVVPKVSKPSSRRQGTFACRYVLIHWKDFDWDKIDHDKLNIPAESVIPIEEEQVYFCLLTSKRMSECHNVREIIQAGHIFHVAKHILNRDIHNLQGWDLVGYRVQSNQPQEAFIVARIWGRKRDERLFVS
ncbi:hypothetical protein RhiJN_25140 [Ceratobasidium sp. AG-Ba]|nr:hypothetical protein RhiJN_25140 [Ceratobasidium sp. AG-Ba]